jgi:hypothetical protein
MNDHLLRMINPVPTVAPDTDPGTRDALMREIVTARPASTRTRRRVLTASAVGGSVLALGAGTAFALGAFGSPTHEALTYCSLPGNGGLVDVAGPTGDPVENCRYAWQHATGEDAPVLVAYQHSSGRVEVYPADQPAPEGYQRLTSGTQQDSDLIALNEGFSDYVSGLAASCLNEPQARAKAASIIARSGVTGWPVSAEASPGTYPAGTTLCWQAAANANDHTVHVGAAPADPAATDKVDAIAAALRPSLTDCWSMQTAAARVEQAIANSSFTADEKRTFAVRQVSEPGASCTTVHVNAGGTLTFTLRGPA